MGGGDKPVVVLGVLQVAFRHDGIAARLRVARKLEIFLGDMLRGATNFHVRSVDSRSASGDSAPSDCCSGLAFSCSDQVS